MKTKLLIIGAGGRMGQRICALALESGLYDLVGAVESSGHGRLGHDAGTLCGAGPIGVTLQDNFPSAADLVIDFSLPQATDKTIDFCKQTQAALVLGTTGLDDRQRDRLALLGREIPIVQATNMSVGVNVLFALVGQVAAHLGEAYDIEIIEQHHRFKKDAPSGTALSLAESICADTGRPYPDCLVYGRSGKDAERQKGTIGMHAVRAGDIVGEHIVLYSTLGETVTIRHSAHSRDTLVRGALRAAQWLIKQKPGLYSMRDVLGI